MKRNFLIGLIAAILFIGCAAPTNSQQEETAGTWLLKNILGAITLIRPTHYSPYQKVLPRLWWVSPLNKENSRVLMKKYWISSLKVKISKTCLFPAAPG
jgi:hypothetical protein